jgi:hypothetical protein
VPRDRFTRGIQAALAALAFAAAANAGANAEGVTRVQQSDGSVQVYRHVGIELSGQTLWLRSPDRKDALEVANGACSFAGSVQRCLPFATTLHRHGAAHPIELERGTVYLNLSDAAHSVPHSSERLAPRNVLVLLHTVRGTIVSVKGTLDDVK